MLPMNIEPEMEDTLKVTNKEWKFWNPIGSKVTDNDLDDFERQIGHKLPNEYRIFLKYKHFYELNISFASFCSHPVNLWRFSLSTMMLEPYLDESLVTKGLLTIANWGDWGFLCFDVNLNKGDSNYPVVLIDHENINKIEKVFIDFYDLIVQLDVDEVTNLTT